MATSRLRPRVCLARSRDDLHEINASNNSKMRNDKLPYSQGPNMPSGYVLTILMKEMVENWAKESVTSCDARAKISNNVRSRLNT